MKSKTEVTIRIQDPNTAASWRALIHALVLDRLALLSEDEENQPQHPAISGNLPAGIPFPPEF